MSNPLTVGSLFAGIGGFDLGLERAGFEIAWQVEIDPYCQRVLANHWPHVQRYGDVRSVDWGTVEPVDVLCGGFPCQDISLAGKGAGLAGERSGLWFEYAKAIEALTPRYVVIENVAALRSRGLDQVLGSLAALGYDAEWHCIPASAIGAPHRRDRVWIVAHARSSGGGTITAGHGLQAKPAQLQPANGEACADNHSAVCSDVADTDSAGLQKPTCAPLTGILAKDGESKRGEFSRGTATAREHWAVEPDVGRVAHGVPHRVDRLKGLGNAIVPQIAEMIGAWILLREEVSV